MDLTLLSPDGFLQLVKLREHRLQRNSIAIILQHINKLGKQNPYDMMKFHRPQLTYPFYLGSCVPWLLLEVPIVFQGLCHMLLGTVKQTN